MINDEEFNNKNFQYLLEQYTGLPFKEVNYNDEHILNLYNDYYILDIVGKLKNNYKKYNPFFLINELDDEYIKPILKQVKPRSLNDYIKCIGMAHGDGVYKYNNDYLLRRGYSLNELICNREDIYDYLVNKYNCDQETSFKIQERVRKGLKLNDEDYKYLKAHKIPIYLINSMNKCKYIYKRQNSEEKAIEALKYAYYKVYYPYEFYIAYLKTYYDKYNIYYIMHNYKDFLTKKEVDDDYDLFKLGMLVIEANNRLLDLNSLDNKFNKDFIGYSLIENLKFIELDLKTCKIINKQFIKDNLNRINIIYDYYQNDYNSISKFNIEAHNLLIKINKILKKRLKNDPLIEEIELTIFKACDNKENY